MKALSRNNLINYNFYFNGNVASWDDIKFLFKHDQQLTDISLLPETDKKHLYPNGFRKMKVKLAT